MRRHPCPALRCLAYAGILAVIISAPAFGQYTKVTAQILDPNSNAYASGSWQANLDISSVPTGKLVQFQGSTAFQTAYSGQLDSSGNLSVSLPDNNVITPVGDTKWNFNFCQYYTTATQSPAPVCFSLTLLITGSSEDITSQAQAAAALLPLTTTTVVRDKGGQVFNVKAYGAKGDDVTDDQAAFMAAWNAAVTAGGGTVYIPPPLAGKCYLINSTLDFTGTGTSVRGIRVTEAGDGSGSLGICMNTGGMPFINLTGSGNVQIDHLTASAQVAGLSSPSEEGIIDGRTAAGDAPGYVRINDNQILLPVHTSGATISYGIYFYGVELSYNSRDIIRADYPLIVTATNIKNLASALKAWGTGTQSETQDSFRDMELLTDGLGPAALFDGASNMVLSGHVWNASQNATYPAGLYNYALQITGGNKALDIHFRQEGYPGFADVTNFLESSQLVGNSAPGPTVPLHGVEFHDASSVIIGDTFNIQDEYASASANAYYDANVDATTGVAVLDSNSFFCGKETDCINIPYGNYNTTNKMYAANITVAGSDVNRTPTVTLTEGTYGTSAPVNINIPTGVKGGQVFNVQAYGSLASTLAACPAAGCVIDGRQAAFDFGTFDPGSKAVKILLGPYTYNVTTITMRTGLQIIGTGNSGNVSTDHTVLQSTSATNQPVFQLPTSGTFPGIVARGMTFDNFQIIGASGNTTQKAIDATALTNGGGVWYSQFKNISITSFKGVGINFSTTAVGSPASVSQFNRFEDVFVFRPVGGDKALNIVGNNGQFSFNNCEFDGGSSNDGLTNVFIGQENTTSTTYPYSINFLQTTIQGAGIGVDIQGAQNIAFINDHFEGVHGAFHITAGPASIGSSGITIDRNLFFSTGINAGSGYLAYVDVPNGDSFTFDNNFAFSNTSDPDKIITGSTTGAWQAALQGAVGNTCWFGGIHPCGNYFDYFAAVPTGACNNGQMRFNTSGATGTSTYFCQAGAWVVDPNGGTCTMAAGTTCTSTIGTGKTACIATPGGSTPIASACSISGTTLTVTAASSNSATWAWHITK